MRQQTPRRQRRIDRQHAVDQGRVETSGQDGGLFPAAGGRAGQRVPLAPFCRRHGAHSAWHAPFVAEIRALLVMAQERFGGKIFLEQMVGKFEAAAGHLAQKGGGAAQAQERWRRGGDGRAFGQRYRGRQRVDRPIAAHFGAFAQRLHSKGRFTQQPMLRRRFDPVGVASFRFALEQTQSKLLKEAGALGRQGAVGAIDFDDHEQVIGNGGQRQERGMVVLQCLPEAGAARVVQVAATEVGNLCRGERVDLHLLHGQLAIIILAATGKKQPVAGG